jgi:hypothetical protein
MEIFISQKAEANNEFVKFVDKNYRTWIKETSKCPIMSHTLVKDKIMPQVEKGKPLFFVLIDNLRWDQWKTVEPLFANNFKIITEDTYYAMLPTSTQYARNAIFSGMLPVEIQKKFPTHWVADDEENGKNMHEEFLFGEQLKSLGRGDLKFSYTKITNHADGETLVSNIQNLMHNDINIIVYNFIDMLSHARTEMEVLKELAADEKSYRSITASWFEHSPLNEALKKVCEKNIRLIITTDHGSIRVKNPVKVIGDRQTTTNIRYKHGRNLNYNPKEVISFKDPAEGGLPKPNVNSSYIFSKEDGYLVYPNNYNHFVRFYNDTFQHGGASLEEMIVPIIILESK